MHHRAPCVAIVLAVLGPVGACENDRGHGPLQVQLAQPGFEPLRMRTELSGESRYDPLQVRLIGAGADTSYHSNLVVGDGLDLIVYPAGGGAPVTFTEHPISADFYHLAHLLIVSVGPEGRSRSFHYFYEPVRWSTVPGESGEP